MGWCGRLAMPAGLSDEKTEVGYEFVNRLLGPDYGTLVAEDGNYAATSIIRDKLSKEEQSSTFIDDLSVMDAFS